MRSGKNNTPLANLAIDHSSTSLPRINVQFFRIARENLNPLKLGSIDKHTTSIIIRPKDLRCLQRRCRLQLCSTRTSLTLVNEPPKGSSTTDPLEKRQLTLPNHLHRLITHLELASLAAVVPSRTEPQVCASTTHKLLNTSVASPVQHPTVSHICSSGDHQQCAGQRPGLPDQHLVRHGDHGIVGGQQAT